MVNFSREEQITIEKKKEVGLMRKSSPVDPVVRALDAVDNEQLNGPWMRLYVYMTNTTQRNWRRQRGGNEVEGDGTKVTLEAAR